MAIKPIDLNPVLIRCKAVIQREISCLEPNVSWSAG